MRRVCGDRMEDLDMDWTLSLGFGLSLAFSICANYSDYRIYKIKNKLLARFLVIALLLHFLAGDILQCLGGLLFPLVLLPLFALRMLGAGDVKALCVVGALVAFPAAVMTTLCAILTAGVLACGVMLTRRNAKQRFQNLWIYLKCSVLSRKLMEYNESAEGGRFRFSFGITAGIALAAVFCFRCAK